MLLEYDQKLINDRINTPIVNQIFTEYCRGGAFSEESKFVHNVPEIYREPLIHSLSIHVTREKGVFSLLLSSPHIEDKSKLASIAATTEVLWSVSLMVDDIVDQDTVRANRETSWVRFGREATMQSARCTVAVVGQHLKDNIGDEAVSCMNATIETGMKSLDDDSVRTLDTNVPKLVKNIRDRALFQCTLPIKLAEMVGLDAQVAERAEQALHANNLAGQILNDLKDLVPTNLNGRPHFSDIKSGTATIPLLALVETLEVDDKELILRLFGKGEPGDEESNYIGKIVRERLPVEIITQQVCELYNFFRRETVATVGGELPIISQWINYKLGQMNSMVRLVS